MNIFKEICMMTRGNGNTSWILKCAIENPNCIIVYKNISTAQAMEKNIT